MRCLRLPFTFDPDRLREDLDRVAPAAWIPHVQRRHYDGRWSGAALRSLGGAADNLAVEAHGAGTFADTPLLARCAYFRSVLATFRCPLHAARLLRLHAGSSIAEHVDRALDFEDGEVRLHIPIVTSDAVRFFLDGARLVMAPGECWYTNVNLPHSVENHGTTDRVHLVIDCRVDDWLRDLFARTPLPFTDQHRATLDTLAAAATNPLVEAFAAAAAELGQNGAAPRFLVEGSVFILAWPGAHSWQIRLRADATGQMLLESSPDPAGLRRTDFDTVLRHLQAGAPAPAETAS